MNLPPLKSTDVSIGYSGIELVNESEITSHQIGYSVTSDGESLIGNGAENWKANWVVIGHETGCGDPIFIDSNRPDYPVYTAMHGSGSWEPKIICRTYDSFIRIIEKLEKLAAGREYPTRLEEKPMTQTEYDEFLSFVMENAEIEDTHFWGLMISDDNAGIGPEI